MPSRRSAHPSTHWRAGRPPRQRHAHASQQHAQQRAGNSSTNPDRWSASVNANSDAMDIEHDIFKTGSALEIAQSLKHWSEHSRRRKGTPYQSAMPMLNFYINRAGRNLPKTRRATLERARKELRSAFRR